MKKKILISAGGSGGHLYPAQALANQLRKNNTNFDILFVGGKLSKSKYFSQSEFPYKEISCGSFTSYNPIKEVISMGQLLKGTWQSYQIIKEFKPDLIVGFGSYHTVPTLIASLFTKTPLILHSADSVPGKVIKLFSPYAVVTGIHFPETANVLKGRTQEVGMPLREGYSKEEASASPTLARQYFELSPNLTTLLVFGGSQGARAINRFFSEATIMLRGKLPPWQVIHLTGDYQWTQALQALYRNYNIPACVKEFEPQMDLAWLAADLVISRAGASTIAEHIAFEVPGIFVPYPFANNHQEKNAEFAADVIKGAFLLKESHLSSDILANTIHLLLKNDAELLKTFQMRLQHHKHEYQAKHSKESLCQLVLNTLRG